MKVLSHIYDNIALYNAKLLGFIISFLLLFFIYTLLKNWRTRKLYKREISGNYKKFTAKRCLEDGISKYRDYIYLVQEGKFKKCHRIVNLYTLEKLGYPRPSRDDADCFRFSDGYVLEDEIKIYNLLADIKEIIKLKDV